MKKFLTMTIVLMLFFCFTGCGDSGAGDGMDNMNSDGVIHQYFGNYDYVLDSSNTDNTELCGPVDCVIQTGNDENKYIEAVYSLGTLPEEGGQYCTMMSDSYVINNITVNDGVAYVDFSSENLAGDVVTETILIDQIVYTLSNSFEEITAVHFTVDGAERDTLMGNVDIRDAFVADYLDL